MTTEAEFEAAVAKAPEAIRDAVYDTAWGNSWSAETYHEYRSDAERWAVAIMCAEMVIDAPADYGIN